MKDIDLIYQYLKDSSDESIEKFCKLFCKSPEQERFVAEDIPQLCNVLLKIEYNLEDENSYNIDWPLKDNILDMILCLVVESEDGQWIDVIVRFMNSFNSIPRPYLQHANDVIISEFLFGELKEDPQIVAKRRNRFLKSLKSNYSDYTQTLNNFCLDYVQMFEKRIPFEVGVNRDALEKAVRIAKKILCFLKTEKDISTFESISENHNN